MLNTTAVPHPMHLHGFYFDVNSRGNGTIDSVYAPTASRQRVVTERLAPGRTATMTWVPERTGNWLFHCHDNYHVLRNAPLDGTPLPAEQLVHPKNHTLEMMGGLVMGIDVRGHDVQQAALVPEAARDGCGSSCGHGGTDAEPAYGYVLQGGTTSTPSGRRCCRVRRSCSNAESRRASREERAPEATVHWRGIRISYFDGVRVQRRKPSRRRSRQATRSWPASLRRALAFMYHPHADETRGSRPV